MNIADKRRWWPLAVLILLVITTWIVWCLLPSSTTIQLDVVNLSNEVVELELYGVGLEQPVSSGPLSPQQQLSLSLVVRDDGELRLHAVSARASVDSRLLPQASQLREIPQQLQIREGTQFVLMPREP